MSDNSSRPRLTPAERRHLQASVADQRRNGRPYADFIGTGANAGVIARLIAKGFAEPHGHRNARLTPAGYEAGSANQPRD